jgi:hypothetical protein
VNYGDGNQYAVSQWVGRNHDIGFFGTKDKEFAWQYAGPEHDGQGWRS